MKTLPLTRGLVALVDDEDFEELSQYKWHATGKRGRFYAGRNVRNQITGKQNCLLLHRSMMNAKPGQIVDHKSNDSLDCQKRNLRFATISQNNHNAKVRVDNTSGFKGVVIDKRTGLWRTMLTLGGKRKRFAACRHAIDAAQTYLLFAFIYYGDFARST